MNESKFVRFQLARLRIMGDRLAGLNGSASEHMERVCTDQGLTVDEYFACELKGPEPIEALAFERLLLSELMSPECGKHVYLELQIRGALRDARRWGEAWIVEDPKGATPVVLEHVIPKSNVVDSSELGAEPSDDADQPNIEACPVQTVLHHPAEDLRHLLVRPREGLEYLLRNPRREHLVPPLLRAFVERTATSTAKSAKRIASGVQAPRTDGARPISAQKLRGFVENWMRNHPHASQRDAVAAAQAEFPGKVTRNSARECFRELHGGQLTRGPKGPRKRLNDKPK